MDVIFIAIGILGTTLAAIAIAYVFKKNSESRADISNLSELLGGTVTYESATTELEGVELTYGLFSQGSGNNKTTYFMLKTPMEDGFDFEIALEGGFDNFAKKFGFATEVQTGDKIFDDRFYLSSSSKESLQLLVQKTERRQLISKFFDAGFLMLSCSGSKLVLKASDDIMSNGASPEKVKEIALDLIGFRKEVLSSASEGMSQLGVKQRLKQRSVPFFVVGSLCILGLAFFLWGLVSYPPLDAMDVFLFSLQYSLAPLALVLYWVYTQFQERSDGHKLFLIALLTLFPGAIGGGYGGVAVYNGYYDKSPAETHIQKVINVRYSKSDDSTNYYATVESWRPGNESEEIEISRRDYKQLKRRRGSLEIVTHHGALNYEWFVSYKLLAA